MVFRDSMGKRIRTSGWLSCLSAFFVLGTSLAGEMEVEEGMGREQMVARLAAIEARLEVLDAKMQSGRARMFEHHRLMMEARRDAMAEEGEIRTLEQEIRERQQEILELQQRFNRLLIERAGLDKLDSEATVTPQQFGEWSHERQRLALEKQRLSRLLEHEPIPPVEPSDPPAEPDPAPNHDDSDQ